MRWLSLLFMVACTLEPPGDDKLVDDGLVTIPEPPEDETPAPDPSEDDVPEVEPPEDPCPPGVICVESLPFADANTTSDGQSQLDAYSCAPQTDESGPEKVYQVEIDAPGILFATLDDGPGVDVDVHLLEETHAGTCLDRGHWEAGAYVRPGTYYVVVDSWSDGEEVFDGDYTLDIVHTAADAFVDEGLAAELADLALYAWDKAWIWDDIQKPIIAIVDFTTTSDLPRTWVLDLQTSELLWALYTSHGIGSQDDDDVTMADTFSDVPDSLQSSIGAMRCSERYVGSQNRSMRLDGLEDGFNGNVRRRAIVVHEGDYATEEFVDQYGYCGRSHGCFVYDPEVIDDVLDALADGGMLWAYADDPDWLARSDYLQGF